MCRGQPVHHKVKKEGVMHRIQRAMFDLRRGLPVVMAGSAGYILVQALEAGNDETAWLQELAGTRPALLLTARRLGLLGADGRVAEDDAARLSLPAGLSAARIQELAFGADPASAVANIDLRNDLRTADDAERAGLALTRRALLLPAALAAQVTNERLEAVHAAITDERLLTVPAAQALDLASGTHDALKRVSEASIPLEHAPQSRFVVFREGDGLREHLAVVIGEPGAWNGPVPVRLHSACLTGDLFGSLRCDCGEQLRNAVAQIDALGGGVLLYLAQEGRGIGLANKLRAYALQDQGLDTLEADRVLGFDEDERHYGAAVDMLSDLGIRQVRLLTNNPTKLRALAEGGIEVTERQGIYGRLNGHNYRYLSAKAERAGHLLDEVFVQRPPQD